MECNYRGHSKATVWPWRTSPQVTLLLVACLVLCCAPHWSGSIGALLAKNNSDGRVYLRDAPADMGAAKAGMHPGDELTAIDGKAVLGMSPSDIHRALAGPVGTIVKLTISRAGESVTFEVERGPLRGE